MSGIILTFETSHVILLVGDMNAIMVSRQGNERDQMLMGFAEKHSLMNQQVGTPTYVHASNTSSSEIDYIFYTKKGEEIVTETRIINDMLNTSDHVPITIGVQVSASRCEQTDQVVRVKPKWDKCDKYRYRDVIAHSLASAQSNIENELDFLFALGHMTSVLKTATSKSIPNHKSVINVKSSRPRWLSWMRRPTGDQEVAGSTPAEVGNILSWRLIMKYFLRSFSPFR